MTRYSKNNLAVGTGLSDFARSSVSTYSSKVLTRPEKTPCIGCYEYVSKTSSASSLPSQLFEKTSECRASRCESNSYNMRRRCNCSQMSNINIYQSTGLDINENDSYEPTKFEAAPVRVHPVKESIRRMISKQSQIKSMSTDNQCDYNQNVYSQSSVNRNPSKSSLYSSFASTRAAVYKYRYLYEYYWDLIWIWCWNCDDYIRNDLFNYHNIINSIGYTMVMLFILMLHLFLSCFITVDRQRTFGMFIDSLFDYVSQLDLFSLFN